MAPRQGARRPSSGAISIHDVEDPQMEAMLRRLVLVNEPLAPADDVLRRLERRRSDEGIAVLKRRLESLDNGGGCRTVFRDVRGVDSVGASET